MLKTANGGDIRMAFTTYKRANACTKARVRYALGDDLSILRHMGPNNGISVIAREELIEESNFQKIPNDPNQLIISGDEIMLKDICVLDKVRNKDAAIDGVVLDYEPQDGRSEAQTFTFIKNIRDNVTHPKGKKLFIYTNPLGSGGSIRNGIGKDNAYEISEYVDALIPVVWSGAYPGRSRSFAPHNNFLKQWNIFTRNGELTIPDPKLIMGVSLYDLDTTDAIELYKDILSKNLLGVWIWQNGAKQNKDCNSKEKQAISCLIFGQPRGAGFADCQKKFSD